MKESVFIVMIICCIFGCSNNDAEKSVTREDVDLGDVISWDEFISSDSVDFTKWDSCPSSMRYVGNNLTLYGYTSQVSSGNKKVILDQYIATALGIPRKIYIMELVTVYYNLTIPGLSSGSCFFTQAPSPNCGMDPNNNTNIGYASSINGNNVTLATKLVYINSDLSGVSYNMWYTRSPSNLEWNYILIN